jgi:peptidoglycan/xylan/chitin deacetylase (PgdA/CDA1 family)
MEFAACWHETSHDLASISRDKMPLWKRLLLTVYYYASCPQRARQAARLRTLERVPLIVLFYHRVADDRLTPWTTPTRAFERQIRWLSRHFELVSLAEVQRRLRAGRNDRPAVAITFDDGYADNCRRALPLLIDEGIPCTYFVSSRHVIEGTPFPHDEALGRPLSPNTPEQIRALARAGVDIGAHTRTHADLARRCDPARLFDELVVAQRELQGIAEAPVRYFAFPYGQHANLSREAFNLARGVYDGVCSAYGGFNFPGDDPFHLQRIAVGDDLVRLKNWVTLDPRKLRKHKRYEYAPPESETAREPAGASR